LFFLLQQDIVFVFDHGYFFVTTRHCFYFQHLLDESGSVQKEY